MNIIADFVRANSWWLSVVVAIIVGLVVNLVSPSIRGLISGWWASRSLSASQNRLNKLQARLNYVTGFYEENDKLIMQSIFGAFRVLILIAFGLAINVQIILGAGFLLFIPAGFQAWEHSRLLRDVIHYNDFVERTQSEIQALQAKVNSDQ